MPLGRRLRLLRGRLVRRLPFELQTFLRRRYGTPRPWDHGVELGPPECPPGMRIGPPDFVGIGVQKAGTSWWYSLLVQHPEVDKVAGVHKEIHFFKDFLSTGIADGDPERYHRWFPRRAGKLTGEWTPDYIDQFWALAALMRMAPEARILVMVRDPVERFRSALAHHSARGRPLDAAVVQEAFHRGFYARQLGQVYRHFPRSRVLVLQYEQCVRDPESEIARTYDFLGIDRSFVPPGLGRTVHGTRARKVEISGPVRSEMVERYAPDVSDLLEVEPKLEIELWPNFSR